MHKCRKLTLVLIAVLLISVMSVAVMAERELPDLSRKGSITVTVRDTETGEPVSGGSLTLYRVAAVQVDNGNYFFAYTPAYEGCGANLASLETDARGLALELADYAAAHDQAGTKASISKDGTVIFSDLELGLYLVVQDTPAKDFKTLTPFLVTVPFTEGETLSYDVDASPKTGTEREPTVPPTTEPPPPELPYTGQLWWPVPVLAFLGLACISVGWLRRKHETE